MRKLVPQMKYMYIYIISRHATIFFRKVLSSYKSIHMKCYLITIFEEINEFNAIIIIVIMLL